VSPWFPGLRKFRPLDELQVAWRERLHSAGVDALTEQLAHGNLNPGLGSKHLLSGIHEARAANGGRVYFRNTEAGLEILAKSDKSTQSQVISILRQVYGH
jgi:hypothetical protein